MKRSLRIFVRTLVGAVVAWGVGQPASAYDPEGRLSSTATNPSTGGMGDPATVTWSIIPDGTLIREEQEPSNLIAFLDELYEETATGTDVTNRTWFGLFEQALARWNELGGLTVRYEAHDDGVEHGEVEEGDGMFFPGELDVRGDVRIGGANIDGMMNTVAYNYYPDVSDMVLDTADTFFDSKANNSRPLRNALIHEMGHAFGLGHVSAPISQTFIMQPTISQALQGPQFDDVLGLHHLYGDQFEKTHNGAGNDAPLNATPLGSLASGTPLSIGMGVGATTTIGPTETDFVSIANSMDSDYFSFTIASPAIVDLVLTPVGPTYMIAPQGEPRESFESSAVSDLSLALLDATGQTTLASVNAGGLGMLETISQWPLLAAGDYLVRITGTADAAQMYRLELSMADLTPGDYNFDGTVDAADYTVWRSTLGQSGAGLRGDGNGDNLVGAEDYLVWKMNFGTTAAPPPQVLAAAVPESDNIWLLAVGLAGLVVRRMGERRR